MLSLPAAKKISCNKMTAKMLKKWFKYFSVFWLFNIVGEAIPQLIIRSVLLFKTIIHFYLLLFRIMTGSLHNEIFGFEKFIYQTHAIINRRLYIFYPIFHCGLYCRAVYNAERLIFHGSFFSKSRQKNGIAS